MTKTPCKTDCTEHVFTDAAGGNIGTLHDHCPRVTKLQFVR